MTSYSVIPDPDRESLTHLRHPERSPACRQAGKDLYVWQFSKGSPVKLGMTSCSVIPAKAGIFLYGSFRRDSSVVSLPQNDGYAMIKKPPKSGFILSSFRMKLTPSRNLPVGRERILHGFHLQNENTLIERTLAGISAGFPTSCRK